MHIRLPTETNITGTIIFLISLNINEFNSVKRHKLTYCIHKQDPAFSCTQETHLNDKDRYYLRVKAWEKGSYIFFQESGPKKQAGVAILISSKIDFQPKVIK
jgi:exonuclease III